MSLTVIKRPFRANAATAATYLVVESNRAVATPYTPTEYEITPSLPISPGTELVLGVITLELITNAAVYDPLNPNHVDATTTDATELKRRIANAINNHNALKSIARAFFALSAGLRFVSVDGRLLDFTPTVSGSLSLTLIDAGAIATTRPSYRLVTECYTPVLTNTPIGLQELFQAGTSLAIPSKITSAETKTPSEQYPFELQRILRGFLGYDDYYSGTNPRYLGNYAKSFFVRYREEWTGFGGKWLFDPVAPLVNPNDPYDADIVPLDQAIQPFGAHVHLVVNAQTDIVDTLPEQVCGGFIVDYPNALQPYFEAIERNLLSTFGGKVSHHGAHEQLAFFVGIFDGINLSTLALKQRIVLAGGQDTTVETPITAIAINAPCYSDLTNQTAGHTIEINGTQLWANVPDNAVQVCNQITAVLPTDKNNVYLLGDDGTFEALPLEHEAFDFVLNPSCGSPEVTVDRTNTVAFAGTHSMGVFFGCDWSDETFKIRGTADTTLLPNTEYEITAWVFVPANIIRAFDQGASLWIAVSGYAGASVTIVDTYNYQTDTRGQWRQLRTILQTSAATTGRIELHNDSLIVQGGNVEGLFIDNIRVQQTSRTPLTKQYTFELTNPCKSYVTFCYQNPLGVPETLHLEGQVLRGWSFESETAKAKQIYTTAVNERRESFALSTDYTPRFVLQTKIESYNLYKINELLRSGYVDWITDDAEQPIACTELLPQTQAIPVIFATDEVDPAKISNGLLDISLEFSPSRQTKRAQK